MDNLESRVPTQEDLCKKEIRTNFEDYYRNYIRGELDSGKTLDEIKNYPDVPKPEEGNDTEENPLEIFMKEFGGSEFDETVGRIFGEFRNPTEREGEPEKEKEDQLSDEEKEKRATAQFKDSVRSWIKGQLDSGYSIEDADPTNPEVTRRMTEPERKNYMEAVDRFQETVKGSVGDSIRAVEYKVFEEFAPIGGQVRSYFERTKIKPGETWKRINLSNREEDMQNDEMWVTWDRSHEDYVIYFPGLATDFKKDINDQLIRISDIPEIAQMVFEHNADMAYRSNLDGQELYRETGRYINQIQRGEGFEPEIAEKVREVFERMEERLGKLREAGEELKAKYLESGGPTAMPPEVLRQAGDKKRAQIIDDWKGGLRVLQDQNEVAKARKTIESI